MDLYEALAGVFAFLVSAGFFKWLSIVLKKWFQDRKYINGFGRVGVAGKIMEDMTNYGADRVLLFAGKNGGGVPSVGKPYSVSLMLSAGGGVDPSIASDYVDLPVDMHYVKLLEDIGRKDYTVIDVEALPRSQIKYYYQAENIKHSIWFYVGLKDMSFLFLSISRHEHKPYSQDEITRILLKANSIKRALK